MSGDRPSRPKCIASLCWEHLAEDPVQVIFNSHLLHSKGIGDIEPEWAMFQASIIEAAIQSYSRKVATASHSGNPRIWWWTTAIKGATRLAYQIRLACGTL